jgi:hypothetical protein
LLDSYIFMRLIDNSDNDSFKSSLYCSVSAIITLDGYELGILELKECMRSGSVSIAG